MRHAARLLTLVSFPFVLAGAAVAQCAGDVLTASDTAAGDGFGTSVSVFGNTALVGKPRFAVSGFDGDSAYFYERQGSGWVEVQKVIASDAANGEDFGSAVDLRADRAVISDPFGRGLVPGSGCAYVFARTSTGWVQEAKLVASDGAGGDFFGSAVDLSPDEDRIIVGASKEGGRGAAYVFEFNGFNWSQVAKLVAPDIAPGDDFGVSATIDGNWALVGAWFDDDKGSDSGGAYVYRRIGSIWSFSSKLTASDGAFGDNFGIDVSLQGDRVCIGACGDDNRRGSAYIFERSGSTWLQRAKFFPSDGAPNDLYAAHVALDGDQVVAGSHGNLGSTGAGYLVERVSATSWVETAKLTLPGASSSSFIGQDVALSNGDALVGAPFDSATGPHFGSAFFTRTADAGEIGGGPLQVSVSAGGVHALGLSTCPPRPNLFYLVLGSATGTAPAFSIDGFELPLVVDAYTNHMLLNANVPPFVGTTGLLDGSGKASASIVVPAGTSASLAGVTLHHAFIVIELLPTLLQIVAVSNNAAQLVLTP